jgi:hypothetical protein
LIRIATRLQFLVINQLDDRNVGLPHLAGKAPRGSPIVLWGPLASEICH